MPDSQNDTAPIVSEIKEPETPEASTKAPQNNNRNCTTIATTIKPKVDYANSQCSCGGRNYAVDVAATLFGVGAWLAVNGVWTELPVLVANQPEGWSLPSYLSITTQAANVGAVAYALLHRYCRLKPTPVILLLMGLGVASLLLLASLWWETAWFAGAEHSVALLSLVFVLALVDCTSSVVFLPFMATFAQRYLATYFVGESLSGLLPALVALAQGVGGNAQCVVTVHNDTEDPWTSYSQYTPPPTFTADVFFYALGAMMAASGIAFIFLRYHPMAKREHVVPPGGKFSRLISSNTPATDTSEDSSRRTSCQDHDNIQQPTESSRPHQHDHDSHDIDHNITNEKSIIRCSSPDIATYGTNCHPKPPSTSGSDDSSTTATTLSRTTYGYLLAIQTWLCFLQNGVLLSIQSYTCLPYGNLAYHLVVTLSNVAATLFSLAVMVIGANRGKLGVAAATVLATLLAAYLLVLAVLSPAPPLLDSDAGTVLVVVAWVVFTGVTSHTKTSVAVVLRSLGSRALFWCGAVTQLGSFLGSVLMFVLVDVQNYFQSNDPCQPFYKNNLTMTTNSVTSIAMTPIWM